MATRERRRLAARLIAMRDQRAWSRERAAENIGIHAVHLARIEAGSANVTLSTLVAIALAYEVSIGTLFERERRAGSATK